MCGRYTLVAVRDLPERFNLFDAPPDLAPNFNAAPGQVMPVVTRHSPNCLELMRWGLTPFWAKDARSGYKMINARAESIQDKPAFRAAFKMRRCLIPASAYYEWKRNGHEKTPFLFKLKDQEIFAFAGLYEIWRDEQGGELRTYAIITTAPNELAARVHDRMPAILKRPDEGEWLDTGARALDLLRVLSPYDARLMESYPVSKDVGNWMNNSPALMFPVG